MTDAEKARAWEAVAKNLAQVIELRDGDGVLSLNYQARIHGLKSGEAYAASTEAAPARTEAPAPTTQSKRAALGS